MANKDVVNPFEEHLIAGLRWLRSRHHIRKGMALLLIAVLLTIAGKFAYDLYPRQFALSISGGGMLTKSHFLVKVMEEEASEHRLSLKIVPTPGSFEALQALNDQSLDLAFVQSGIDVSSYPNVRYVASIEPALIQFLVKPNIKHIADIKGKMVNLGKKHEGVSVISNQILHFSGFVPQVDYTETEFTDEELLSMRPEMLPDVIVQVAYAPSPVVDFLVQKRDYHLLEMSFPPSLATRLGWVADAKILSYMYRIVPPVPATDIQVVGVNLNLLANKDVDPRAIVKLLKVLYSPSTAGRFGMPIPEDKILTTSGFPLSAGTEAYLSDKRPFITSDLIERIKSIFGLLMSLASIALVVFRWFRSPDDDEPQQDPVSPNPDQPAPDSHGKPSGDASGGIDVKAHFSSVVSAFESLEKK